MSHTPGPWEVNGVQIIAFPENPDFGASVVSEVTYHSNIPWEANARLIAAAPDLLQVLEAIAGNDGIVRVAIDLHDKARAAIAKAREKE